MRRIARLAVAATALTSLLAVSGQSALAAEGACTADNEACAVIADAKMPKSATFTSSINYTGDTIPGLAKPFRLRLAGKYQNGTETNLPAFNLNFRLSASGSSFNIGFVYVNNRAYIRTGSTFYYLKGQKGVKLAKKIYSLVASSGAQPAFGVAPVDYLTNATRTEPDAVCCNYRIEANIDTAKIFDSLIANLEGIRAKLPKTPKGQTIGDRAIDRLISRLNTLKSAFATPPKTIMVIGKSDLVLRSRTIDAPVSQMQSDGTTLSGHYIQKSTFAKVNQPQVIRDPADFTTIS